MSCFLFALVARVTAAVLVPAGGITNDFTSAPTGIGEWFTVSVPGIAGSVTDLGQLDLLAQSVDATSAANIPLLQPGSDAAQGAASWYNGAVFTRPTSVSGNVLIAKLQNDSGVLQPLLNVQYDLSLTVTNDVVEEIPGFVVYASASGMPNTWTKIGQHYTVGTVKFAITLSSWTNGAPLYLMWMDDNGSGFPDWLQSIDNVVFGFPTPRWVAYNDHVGGVETAPNVTTYTMTTDAAAGGLLTDFNTGAPLTAGVDIRGAGLINGTLGTSSVPSADTPAYNLFKSKVDFSLCSLFFGATPYSAAVTITFTNLSPAKRYNFRGTAVRGGAYPGRWTLVTLAGAGSATPAHQTGPGSPGVVTNGWSPYGDTLASGLQAAFNSGINLCGDVIGWDNIAPAGTSFSVICSNYHTLLASGAAVPGGIIEDNYSYAINAFRLEEFGSEPQVVITAPANNTQFLLPTNIVISAAASDFSGSITNVALYSGSSKLADVATMPFVFNWTNAPAGNYALTAVAMDNGGVRATSAPVNIRVIQVDSTRWTAFNDHNRGPGTGANVTTYNLRDNLSGAPLTNQATGAALPVKLLVSSLGNPITVQYGAQPAAGTPTYNIFNGYVDFWTSGGGDNGSLVYASSGQSITLTFTNLDVTKRYSFRGSSIRAGVDGGTAATDFRHRWTLVSIVGAAFFDNAHSTGCVTAVSLPASSLAVGQAAYNSGMNAVNSDAVGWDNIMPGANGAFSIVSTQYLGAIWGGDAAISANPGYAINGFRLEQTPGGIPVSNAAPAVSISNPSNGAGFMAPANLTINATASDDYGISTVALYQGTTKLGEVSKSPYAWNWNGVTAGNYPLRAVATDIFGLSATSAVVNVIVTNNAPPLVSLTSPTNSTVIHAPTNVLISANASDPDGVVTKVEFFLNGSKLGENSESPYSLTWSNVIMGGAYSMYAVATDNVGLRATSSVVNVTVIGLVAPVVSITAPATNTSFTTPATVNIQAAASDSDGTVTNVEFYAGTMLIGRVTTAPFNFAWSNVAVGNYSLTALAIDNSGMRATSAPVAITVSAPTGMPLGVTYSFNTQPPVTDWSTLSIPGTGGALLTVTDLDVAVGVYAASDINQVLATGSAYAGLTTATWNSSAQTIFTLPTGNGATLLMATLINNTPGPVSMIKLTSQMNVSAVVLEEINGPRAYFSLTGAANSWTPIPELSTNLTGTVTAVLNLGSWSSGSHLYILWADDNGSGVGDGAWIWSSFLAEVSRTEVVAITHPANNTLVALPRDIAIDAMVSGFTNTVTNVVFYAGSTRLGAAASAPYQFIWTNGTPGQYSLTAVAEDNTGNAVASSPVKITLQNNVPPSVAIISPADSTTLTSPANFLINIRASDSDGIVTNVQFFANGTKIGENNLAPFSFSWGNVPTGVYDLVAVARDGNGAATTSSVVRVFAIVSTAPTVANFVPAAGVVTQLTQVTVNFAEPVDGVKATDLLINGIPATHVSGANATYTFAFPQPADGLVAVTWADSQRITDRETPPKPFSGKGAGEVVLYTMADTVPPTVALINPIPGATVPSLTRVDVTFSEPVAGINASDLLMNGIPASKVSGSLVGPYTFDFAQPMDGPVQMTWAANHGIHDLAQAQNAFAANAWSYMRDPSGAETNVVISEIMYHPTPEMGEDSRQEWIELHNKGTSAVNLRGWQFTRGVKYTFGDASIPADGYLVVASNVAEFLKRYPNVTNVVGDWVGTLSNNGDTFHLRNALGSLICNVSYSSQGDWATHLRGLGERQLTLTRNGATVTAYAFAHEYHSGDQIRVYGADQPEYNGTFTVSPTGPSTFTYTITGSPAAATGVIISRQITTCNGGSCFAGWSWSSLADGLGRSLELVNKQLPNDQGQNWAASQTIFGTPGQANSMATNHIAPMILGMQHYPLVPRSTNSVTITARLLDENLAGVTAQLFYRNAGSSSLPEFTTATMADDGLHGDGIAGDGVYGAQIAPLPNLTIIEFYVAATNALGLGRTWPPAALDAYDVPLQQANAHYQVDDSVYTGNQPFYRFVMTEPERAELKLEHDRDANSENSLNAQMNLTFITMDGAESLCVYNSGGRNRGAGSRGTWPMNYRVSFPNDKRWKGVRAIHLNTVNTYSQLAAYAMGIKSGIDVEAARAVQLLVNGVNLAYDNVGMTKGSYIQLENTDSDYAANHYPNDSGGNAYRGSKYPWEANLTYYGTDPNTYYGARGKGYYKNSNVSQNDWSDLINLSAVLSTNTPDDAVYAQAVRQVANVEEWMRSFAVYALNGSGETAFQTGVGDDYSMYRGVKDPRFLLLGHDLDTCFGQGGGSATDANLFRMCPFVGYGSANAIVLNRFMTNRYFAPVYYQQLNDLLNTSFSPGAASRTFDQFLGDWAPDVLNSMKTWSTNRYTWVRSQIPLSLTVTHLLANNSGYAYTTSPTMALSGRANAIDTRTVTVNGQPAVWTAWQARWAASSVSLNPGINQVVVQSFNEAGKEIDRRTLDVWYNNGAENTVAGGSLAGNTVWSPGNPYHVTGGITIPAGSTLTIQPGVIVYFDAGAGLTINGQLLAQGIATAPIRFTRTPGTSGTWTMTINGGAGSPETHIAYAHLEYFGSPGIHSSGGTLFLDHLTFGTTLNQYLSLDDSSFVVQDCVFPTPTAAFEPVHGTGGIKTGGRGIFLRNFFGAANGYSDVIDFTGGNRDLGQPIVQFINNVFIGSGDDLLDLDGTDAWIEGNIFMHAHKNGSPDSSSAISGGLTGNDRSEITIIGNLIYDCDQAANAKEGNFYTMINNTIVRTTRQGGADTTSSVVLMADIGTVEGAGMYLEGNIIYDAEKLVNAQTTSIVTFTNNIIYGLQGAPWSGPGGANVNVDPLFKHLPQLSETTNFTSWAQAQVLWDWFNVQSGSPAAGAGPNGRNLGGVVPLGVSILGEPQGVTSANTATLTVGVNRSGGSIPAGGFPNGSGFTHYKWRLDGGAWSAETPIAEPITLTSLANGPHHVEVSGKNDAGLYQDDSVLGTNLSVTASRVWIVETSAQLLPKPIVRINEVLASNQRAVDVGGGNYPDLIELYNAGSVAADLSGMSLSDNQDDPRKFTFAPGTVLDPGKYLTLYADNSTTPSGIHLGFTLKQEGDDLYLFAANGQLLDSVVFGPQITDLSIGRLSDGQWALTHPTLGSPNVAVTMGDTTKLKINEWLTHGVSAVPYDFVELFNADTRPVNLGGLFLTDNPIGAPRLSELPPLSFIPASGYAVFLADGNPASGPTHLNFRLSADRGVIGLLDQQSVLIDSVLYGPQFTDVSQGRSPNGADTLAFFAMPTPGAPNHAPPGPPGGQLVINEVLARNVPGPNAITNVDGGTPEWIELYNPTASSINLADMSLSDSATDPRKWIFPAGAIIPAGGYLVVLCDPSQPASTNAVALLNTGFGIKASGGEIYLFDKGLGGSQLDGIAYGLQAVAFSIGRVPSGSTNWVLNLATPNGLNSAAALSDPSHLKINEWMANPSAGADWFEIYNPNSQPVALSGLYLTDNLATPATRQAFKVAPLSFIGSGPYGFARFWADSGASSGPDHCNFSLKASGEALGINMEGDVRIDSITFGAQAVDVSSGRLPDGAETIVAFPATGTPAEANYLLLADVVINEVLSAVPTNAPVEQAIELLNTGSSAVNVGGWYLSNMKHDLKKYRLPGGTIIPAGGFLVVYQNQFNFDPRDPTSFALDAIHGDNVYLAAADTNANLTGYRALENFGAADPGVSFGRYSNSVGHVDFTAMSRHTFGMDSAGSTEDFRLGAGATNAYPYVGSIGISEIMYRPADLPGALDNVRDEFIELHNSSSNTVLLYDPANPGNTWHLRGGVSYDFPANVSLPAGGYLLVVSFDPANDTNSLAGFRASYPQLPLNAALFGPFAGKLNNNGESIDLEKPGTPVSVGQPDAGYVPHILVEHVKYNQSAPWDALADGTGKSLRRLDPRLYGNDPANWSAAPPSPGAGYNPNVDSDGDGIPDAWVQQYFGHASGLVADQSRATDDPDGDGMNNLQEYLAGTSPVDPASVLRIFSVSSPDSATNAAFAFLALSNRSYTVEYKAVLDGNGWNMLQSFPLAATNRLIQISVPANGSSGFLRLRTP